MRIVTNKNIISMILLRTGTKSIRGLNYVRTVTKRLSPYLMKSEKGIKPKGLYRTTVERACSCA